MTPDAPIEPPSSKAASVRPPRRSELTCELISSHRAIDVPLPSDEARLAATARAGANWFYWIAALSIINSISSVTGSHFTFLAGLAMTQLADALAAHLGLIGPYFTLGIGVVVAFFLCGFGYLTTHDSRAAFLVGMILYAGDGVLCFLLSLYLSLLLHGFILVQMMVGWRARQELALQRDERSRI